MIVEMKMYGCVCDGCGEQWYDEHDGYVAFTDKSSIQSQISDDDSWMREDDKYYCGKCWSYDDNDNLVLKEKTIA